MTKTELKAKLADFWCGRGEYINMIGICLVVLVPLLCLMLYGTAVETAEHNRLISQCRADGHKEYECIGILRGLNK